MLDAVERVSGRVNYVLNVELPGMLIGKILRSPFAHARLTHVDGSQALRLGGVAAVLTREDFGEGKSFSGKYGRVFRDQTVVAFDKVRIQIRTSVASAIFYLAYANDPSAEKVRIM